MKPAVINFVSPKVVTQILDLSWIAQSAGAVKYTDCTSADG